jgi:ABC-type transport system substrate-binding protein
MQKINLLKQLIACSVLVSGLVLTSSSAASAQQEKPKQGGTLVFAAGGDVLTLDPQFVTDIPSFRCVMHIHETLVKRDPNMDLVPCLAESWTTSADLLTWTFKLKKGVKFQDGTPFNADAVKYTFDRMNNPEIASPRKSSIGMVKALKVIDDHTMAITTNKPFAPLLAQLSSYNLAILSPTAASKWGKKYAQNPVGTGPFKVESWTPGERVVLVRNESYWGEKPYLEKLVFKVFPEDSTRVMTLLSGDSDVIAAVPPVLMKKIESKETKILQQMGFRTVFLGMNNKIKPFTDVRVRKAVAHAVDPQAIINSILSGMGETGGGLESPVIPGAIRGLKPYAHDLSLAKRLLSEAGYPNGFKTSFYTTTGRYLMDRQVAEALQNQLKEAGIQAEIKAPDFGTLMALLDKGTEIPMFLMGKGSPTGDLDFTMNLSFKTGGKMNHFQYGNPKVDALIEEQQRTIDPKTRNQVLYEAQKIFYEDCPTVTLYYESQIFGARANVSGVHVYSHEFIDFTRAWKN